MARVSRTDQVLWVMDRLPDVQARMEYQRNLPKGIGARVLGKLLDRLNATQLQERYRQDMMNQLRRMAEREEEPWDPWQPPVYAY